MTKQNVEIIANNMKEYFDTFISFVIANERIRSCITCFASHSIYGHKSLNHKLSMNEAYTV